MIQVFNLCFFAGKFSQILVFGSFGFLGGDFVVYVLPLTLLALAALGIGFLIQSKVDAQTYKKVLKLILYSVAFILIGQFFPLNYATPTV